MACLEKIDVDNPIAVAREQLDVAIDLFLQETSYISAITLAVAAEQVFARHLKERRQEDVLLWEFGFFDELGLTPSGPSPKERLSKFRKQKMLERDLANHGPDRRRETSQMRPPLKEIAEEAIDRAQTNAILLGLPRSAADERFYEWFLWNVVGEQ